ncbi:MAG TPA: hypothetical protein VFL91_12720 [Thermomicrobiales bacterium]|nr:hypothetical protein [Thermomicrobiales bacterium]
MSGQTHMWIGLAVLIVNLVVGVAALVSARRAGEPAPAYSASAAAQVAAPVAAERAGKVPGALLGGAYLGLLLLVVQILAGFDLLGRGLRPAVSAGLTVVHAAAPLVALVAAAILLPRARGRASRIAAAAFAIVVAALISYGIGEMRA